jgi:phage terminase small subunit
MSDDFDDPPASPPGKTLTPRQSRFVAEYLIDSNGSQAFVRAGYSKTHSRRSVWRLMRIPAVRAAIEAGQQELAASLKVSAERVVAEYIRVAFASVADYLDIAEDGTVRLDLANAPPEKLAAIADVRDEERDSPKRGRSRVLRLKLASKLHALDSLSRHLGLFAPRATTATRARQDDGGVERDLAAELREARERVATWHERFAHED